MYFGVVTGDVIRLGRFLNFWEGDIVDNYSKHPHIRTSGLRTPG